MWRRVSIASIRFTTRLSSSTCRVVLLSCACRVDARDIEVPAPLDGGGDPEAVIKQSRLHYGVRRDVQPGQGIA